MASEQSKHTVTDSQRQAMRTFVKLMRATNSVESRLRPTLGCEGLTESQFGVLEVLYSVGPLCQRAIGEKILKTSGNITLVIDNLEKQDLVIRTRGTDDRRHVQVSLTDKGRVLISNLFPRQARAIEQVMSVLTDDEQEQFGRLCRKLGRGQRLGEARSEPNDVRPCPSSSAPAEVPSHIKSIDLTSGETHDHTDR